MAKSSSRKSKKRTKKSSDPASITDRLIQSLGEDEASDDNPTKQPIPPILPILPVRDTVAFPGTIIPINVGRPNTLKMLEEHLNKSKIIGLVTQQDGDIEEPTPPDMYTVGTAATVLKVIRQSDDSIGLILQGLSRFSVNSYLQTDPFMVADVRPLSDTMTKTKKLIAATKNLRESAVHLLQLSPDTPEQAEIILLNIEAPGDLADFLSANLDIDVDERQDLLEQTNVNRRVRAVQLHVARLLEIAQLQQKIQEDVASTITDSQREMFLREQLKAIQKELGDTGESTDNQIEELRQRIEEADLPENVRSETDREIKRLSAIHPASPEFSVILTYLETIVDLPWTKSSKDNLNLNRARKILDRDHFDLEKVKKRLIEYLAVRKLNPAKSGPILCLVGPPGVGKTSLGQSIADALGREFVRMSLGGVRDEAEIRGHRRTYVGAMPGRIIQEMRRASARNPVFMLDEIDKLGNDFRGDPASALLEVLDPRQNHAFVDHYLDVPFDLTKVIFIATANYMDPVPPALRDRMEVIEIAGYTESDKYQIAKKYLIPRQMKDNGLTKKYCKFSAPAIRHIIEAYTREAGVRKLERRIGSVCRGIAARVAKRKPSKPITVDIEQVNKQLGPPVYVREEKLSRSEPGVVTGLAYTPVGGEVLFVEATKYVGKGNVTLTGQIGDVMKESAQAAYSLVKSRADKINIDPDEFAKTDIHIHVPEGAVPKDGPSAGVAMYTAIASLFTDTNVNKNIAMTGEITLRGLVLPIGGLKEKTIAALRAGIKTVILPEDNQKDMPELTPEVRKKLKFVFVKTVDDVFNAAT